MSGAPLVGAARGVRTREEAVADAPAKVILLGEHAVNRGGRALVTAVDIRVRVRVRVRKDDIYRLTAGEHHAELDAGELAAFARVVDAARAAEDREALAALGAGDFLNPARYVLAKLVPRLGLRGLEARWEDGLPVGCGLGSGAAAHCALAVAAAAAKGTTIDPGGVAGLAWDGDVLAHGGIASALDASGVAFGGVLDYALAGDPRSLAVAAPPPLVVSDSGVVAATGQVNAELARRLEARPALATGFAEIALLVDRARVALAAGDLDALGRAMHLNHLVLERLGLSDPALERLVEAALAAGAYGAKLSGSGRGGIVVAVPPPDAVAAVADAMTAAGGRTFVTAGAASGARPLAPESARSPAP